MCPYTHAYMHTYLVDKRFFSLTLVSECEAVGHLFYTYAIEIPHENLVEKQVVSYMFSTCEVLMFPKISPLYVRTISRSRDHRGLYYCVCGQNYLFFTHDVMLLRRLHLSVVKNYQSLHIYDVMYI